MKTIGLISANYGSSEFGELLENRTLASLPYGGRYRLIDFALSNMANAGITTVGGVYVASVVEGGAASEAGLRKGDVITNIDGVDIDAPSKLAEQIGKHRPNDKIKIIVKRGDNVKHFEVTLRNKAGGAELLPSDAVDVVKVLGGRFVEADEKLCKKLDIRGGVQVVQVSAGGLLAKARVREGFVITHINDRSVSSVTDLNAITSKVQSIDGVYPDGRAAS